eukprot:14475546-Alexandrium_andersonii.AAC.1
MGASRREHPHCSWRVQLLDAGRRNAAPRETPVYGGVRNEPTKCPGEAGEHGKGAHYHGERPILRLESPAARRGASE